MKNFLLLILLSFIVATSAPIIRDIQFVGEHHTTETTLRILLDHDSTASYTPEYIESLKTNLLDSYLFSKIHITPNFDTEDTVSLFIKVDEIPRWTLSDIGLSYYNNLYGQDQIWFHFSAAIANRNFLGRGHKLEFYGGLWKSRYLGVKWEIPFYEKGYRLSFNTRFGHYPSLSRNYNIAPALDFSALIGKYFTRHHLIEVGFVPSLRKYEIALDTLQVDYPPQTAFQLYSKIRWTVDYRDDTFTPRKGIYGGITLLTNAIKAYETPEGNKKRFFQINNQMRGYLPIGKKSSIALRSDLLITPAGVHSFFEQIYMGGSSTIRGFSDNAIGAPVDSTPFYSSSTFNNRFLASAEFRFLIVAPKPFNLSFLKWYHHSMSAFPIQLHGAFFIDAGYLWEDLSNMFDLDNSLYKTAASVGVGLRLVFPSIEMKGGLDLGWPIANPLYQDIHYSTGPVVHMFMGFPF